MEDREEDIFGTNDGGGGATGSNMATKEDRRRTGRAEGGIGRVALEARLPSVFSAEGSAFRFSLGLVEVFLCDGTEEDAREEEREVVEPLPLRMSSCSPMEVLLEECCCDPPGNEETELARLLFLLLALLDVAVNFFVPVEPERLLPGGGGCSGLVMTEGSAERREAFTEEFSCDGK